MKLILGLTVAALAFGYTSPPTATLVPPDSVALGTPTHAAYNDGRDCHRVHGLI